MSYRTYPGVCIEEIPSGIHTVSAVATSITAFFGRTSQGPANAAVRVRSHLDFERTFGVPLPGSELAIAVRLFFQNGGTDCYVIRTTTNLQSYLGSEIEHTGFYALDKVDLFNLMVIPHDDNIDRAHLWGPASFYCKARRAFLIVDPPDSWRSCGDVLDQNTGIRSLRYGFAKDHAAVYYPKLMVNDGGLIKEVSPSGAVAGLFSRFDSHISGIWSAPAGVQAEVLGVSDLSVILTNDENRKLNREGVNCIRKFSSGILVWGARTIDGVDDFTSEWKYIPVRRLSLMIAESVFRGTRFAVFRPNDEVLWADIRRSVGSFMMSLFRQNAFQGNSPDKGFLVKCDSETTTEDDRNRGKVNIVVGFAPLKPAEFVIIKIQQIAGEN